MPIIVVTFLVITIVFSSFHNGIDAFVTIEQSGTISRFDQCQSKRTLSKLFQEQPNNEGLTTQDGAKNQLFSAFNNLDLSDQYDAVLTGLCAKILDTDDTEQVSLQDCQQLLTEMNMKRIEASPRSLMALIDAAVKAQNAKIMGNVISQSTKNPRGIQQFGSQQPSVLLMPSSSTTKVLCPDGTMKTITERLEDVPAIPVDDRGQEITSALAASGVVVGCELVNIFGMSDIQPLTNTILTLIFVSLAVDNFYDILKTTSQFLVQQVGKESKALRDFKLPAKDSLPFGLGSGQTTGSVVRGLTRLLTVDAERESQCEAAALYTAYALGLPCFAFRSNAREGSALVVEAAGSEDSLMTASGILRMLIWLLAPVAMEDSKYPQLIFSDPLEASSFLSQLEEQMGGSNTDELFWMESELAREQLLQWAYAEANVLLRAHEDTVQVLSERLTGGAATIGDCVSVIENWE